MSDDFSNLRNFKKPPLPAADNAVILKKPTKPAKPTKTKKTIKAKPTRMRFIITNNKNNSWVEDLYAQEQLNQMERVYH